MQVGEGRVSGSYQGGVKSVYPVNADSDLAPVMSLRLLSKRHMAY